ncbi:MAG: 4-hydroxybenzoate octaprenyltransferase [Haliea sp.]|nr:4-hydroxybenzoate octaprenyltransferase [Haliea sp.]
MSKHISALALLKLTRFDRPIGTLLLLWPTLGALWIAADGVPSPKLLVIFCLGTLLMRSAGCIVNDLADRHWDGSVARTRERPLVTGEVSVTQARALFLALCLAAFGLVLFTNTLTIALSVVGLLLASTYPFMKRYTYWPQVVLGAAFSWAIPMAFAAQLEALPSALWLLYIANLLWTMVYDTQYAMVDRDDDVKVGIKSTAVLFGEADRLVIGALQGLCLLAWLLAGQRFELGAAYYLGVLAAAVLFGYHQYLIRHRDRAACFKAFRHNNWVGLVIFMGIALHYVASDL